MPGVYIEELVKLPPVIEELPATVPAFIGYTAKASLQGVNDLQNIPHLIKTLGEYETYFGYADSEREDSVFEMYANMQFFFRNGGSSCFVCSIGDFASTSGKVLLADLLNGLNAVAGNAKVNLLLFPDAVKLDNATDFYALHSRAIEQSAELEDRFVIMDVYSDPANGVDWNKDITLLRASLLLPPDKLRYAAAYFPRVFVQGYKTTQLLPVTAGIAGVFTYLSNKQGIWKAPANASLSWVAGVQYNVTNKQQQLLNLDAEGGKSINTIRVFHGKGTLVWGSRTLAGNDHEWRYISASRFCIWITNTLKTNLKKFIFETNNADTWVKVKTLIENYLQSLYSKGAFMGARPQDAFYVHVGAGITMRHTDLLEGRMLIDIGVALSRPSEFTVLKLNQQMAVLPLETLFEAKQTRVFPTKKIPLNSQRTLIYGKSNLAMMAAVADLGRATGRMVVKLNLAALAVEPIDLQKKIDYLITKIEDQNWILLFDEADMLFSKRTEIKNSHDRYANLDTGFLLQRIEAFKGVMVLSAAKKTNIDEAFLRRFNAVVKFI